jgi:hypothetical protein
MQLCRLSWATEGGVGDCSRPLSGPSPTTALLPRNVQGGDAICLLSGVRLGYRHFVRSLCLRRCGLA